MFRGETKTKFKASKLPYQILLQQKRLEHYIQGVFTHLLYFIKYYNF
jgi:hypothetical protein